MTAGPLLLFAPGAGAPSTSSWMRAWARRLATVGDVVPFDYPYAKAGRRSPDKLPVLVAAHREALAVARAHGTHSPLAQAAPGEARQLGATRTDSPLPQAAPGEARQIGATRTDSPLPPAAPGEARQIGATRIHSPLPQAAPGGEGQGEGAVPHGGSVVLVGKSMGGRVGCHVALEEPPGSIAGLVCLGYPLRGQRGQLRDEVLVALRVPVLFVQGSRDALCPLEDLERVRARMTAPTSLHVVEGGNHSLEVGVKALAARGETQEDVDARALAAIVEFVGRNAR